MNSSVFLSHKAGILSRIDAGLPTNKNTMCLHLVGEAHRGVLVVLSATMSSVFGHISHDTQFGFADEVKDDVDFIAHRDLFGYLDNGVFKAEVAGVDNAVGIGHVAHDAFRHSDMFQHDGVDAVVAGRITTEYDIGRNVFLHAASALHQ